MVKASSKESFKSKSSFRSSKTKNKMASKSELPTIDEAKLAEITINLESCHNMSAAHPTSKLLIKCFYCERELGQTEPIILTDEPVRTLNFKFKIGCETDSLIDLDTLSSNPVLFRIYQERAPEESISIDVSSSRKGSIDEKTLDFQVNSTISLYEALTGDKVESELMLIPSPKHKNKTKATQKSSKKLSRQSSKGSKRSKKSLTDKKSSKSSTKSKSRQKVETLKKGKENHVRDETEIGTCVLDLVPLVLGTQRFSQFLQMVSPEIFFDDRLVRFKEKPGLVVTVIIDKVVEIVCKPIYLSVTLESVFNLPELLNEEFEYEACVWLPSGNLVAQQACLLKNGVLTRKAVDQNQGKFWPYLPKAYYNVTSYKLDPNLGSVKNIDERVNLGEIFESESSRIQFNVLKRNLLLKDGFYSFYDHIRTNQRVILELYALKHPTKVKIEKLQAKTQRKASSGVIDAGDMIPQTDYLHLMANIDLSSLLYPGVTKIRVATQLRTFHENEAFDLAGLKSSYFCPRNLSKSVTNVPSKKTTTTTTTTKTKRSKSSKSSKKGKEKSSKKSKKSKQSKVKSQVAAKDLKSALPAEPIPTPPAEPSQKVYNEKGAPTFVILEFELTKPFSEKRSLAELHGELLKLVQAKVSCPKVVFDKQLSTEYYRDVLSEIVLEINENYSVYAEKKALCHCENQADFLTYLKRIGVYQKLVYALTQIASLIAQQKLDKITQKSDIGEYQSLIETIFIELMSEVNLVLHKFAGFAQSAKKPENSLSTLLFYAKEATENGDLALADRYYLARLYRDSSNPDCWFDYAVFHVENGDDGKAFMCLQEALQRKIYHKNSLLLSGILLCEMNRSADAEICLLTLMVQEPKFVEGWTCLYLFYKKTSNAGGMDLALEMAEKYSGEKNQGTTLPESYSLAWCPNLCPDTIFFKTAIILLKMHIYSWVEDALSHELKEAGIVHYLLAVICYFRQDFEHALAHLERARHFYGADHAILSLAGHCRLGLGHFEAARSEYLRVLECGETQNSHLLHINCAKVTDNTQEARKLLLIACKNYPTPYTWISCGELYFKQYDLMSAEECFSEAVVLDNTIPECWAYLTLINLKLKHLSEAEICYSLALKNNLTNEKLLCEINQEFDKLTQT